MQWESNPHEAAKHTNPINTDGGQCFFRFITQSPKIYFLSYFLK